MSGGDRKTSGCNRGQALLLVDGSSVNAGTFRIRSCTSERSTAGLRRCLFCFTRKRERRDMNQNLSLPEWHRLAQEGVCLPMRIQVRGVSMFPLLRSRRDWVTILPIRETPKRGDIILFADPHTDGHYLLHRAWLVETEDVIAWGDNCPRPDGPVPFSHIWGKAVLVERGKRRIEPDPARGLRLAAVWHIVGKGWRFLGRCRHRMGRMLGRAVKKPETDSAL